MDNTPDHLPNSDERYVLMGKRLDAMLDCISKKKDLGGLPDFCARLKRLVFDEGLDLVMAFDELGRQTGGQLYATPFYRDLITGIDGDLHTEQNGIIFCQNLIAILSEHE